MSTNLKEHWRNHTIAQIAAVTGNAKSALEKYLKAMSDTELAWELSQVFSDEDSKREAYKTLEDGRISVCAHCFPRETIKDYLPHLAGVEITHTVCAIHAHREWLQFCALEAAVSRREALEEVAA